MTDVPWRWDVARRSLETRNSYWLKKESSGLGISVNDSKAAQYPFQQEASHSANICAAYGAILRW